MCKKRIPPVDNLSEKIQKYVCALYGQKDVVEVNVARRNLFQLGKFADENLPPNDDMLQQHLLRSNYQAFIWKNSSLNVLILPSPIKSGWMFEGEKLVARWMTRPCAPEGLLKNVTCGCKTGCQNRQCSCIQASLKYTEVCQCINCSNQDVAAARYGQDDTISSDDDSDYELDKQQI